jgi:hypothetical protein
LACLPSPNQVKTILTIKYQTIYKDEPSVVWSCLLREISQVLFDLVCKGRQAKCCLNLFVKGDKPSVVWSCL